MMEKISIMPYPGGIIGKKLGHDGTLFVADRNFYWITVLGTHIQLIPFCGRFEKGIPRLVQVVIHGESMIQFKPFVFF